VTPIIFVTVQLVVLAWTFVAQIRRNPSPVFKSLYLAAYCGVVGMDVWYFANFAYPGGFAW
jgi:hypothetical protein